jgi:putative peptidoglycan binding protein/CHAP domain-containing protein
MAPLKTAEALPFPGHSIKAGESNPEIVLALQRQLNECGCGPITQNALFDSGVTAAVRRFQMRFPDADGLPLKVDGVVGPVTWAALFGSGPFVTDIASPLLAGAVEQARQEIGVMEDPPGSNRGRRVDEYLRAVGLEPTAGSFPWCAAFVYFCFETASLGQGRRNPLVKTGGVLEHWNRAALAGAHRITTKDAAARPELIRPGQIFVIGFGRIAGHTGVIRGVQGGKLVTIEGNTNVVGGREGIGVFERTGRTIGSVNKGFLDYSGT